MTCIWNVSTLLRSVSVEEGILEPAHFGLSGPLRHISLYFV